jgi:hypothetical protein
MLVRVPTMLGLTGCKHISIGDIISEDDHATGHPKLARMAAIVLRLLYSESNIAQTHPEQGHHEGPSGVE